MNLDRVEEFLFMLSGACCSLVFFAAWLSMVAFIIREKLATKSRSRELVQVWANDHYCEIENAEFRWINKGPFVFDWRKRPVWLLTVRDPGGRRLKCWVRCTLGGFPWLQEARVDVSWAGEAPEEPTPGPRVADPRDSPLWDREIDG